MDCNEVGVHINIINNTDIASLSYMSVSMGDTRGLKLRSLSGKGPSVPLLAL
jgi:hypothetical protein